MLAAARSELGRLHARYPGPGLAGARQSLLQADSALAKLQSDLRRGVDISAPLNELASALPVLSSSIVGLESESLFDRAIIRHHFELP